MAASADGAETPAATDGMLAMALSPASKISIVLLFGSSDVAASLPARCPMPSTVTPTSVAVGSAAELARMLVSVVARFKLPTSLTKRALPELADCVLSAVVLGRFPGGVSNAYFGFINAVMANVDSFRSREAPIQAAC